ncbi:hypothetical protein NQK81_02550 [Amycolatopsis roodepoortensis]|uniref:hypothetical protein n=1 Tax=Amycolatopsis roodepoortensis TaxID=700274 RepID=UPI00214D0C63|nr:hypothetical protein [Amycolatopsis roodepoortensis]UUV32354.1 hypothetical protein NQK81_02550 [Amycolatopsis roodepoortensis]
MTADFSPAHESSGVGGDQPSTIDLLFAAYGHLRDAWSELLRDENCDEAAPWRASGPVDADPDEVSRLLHIATISADSAGISVLHHLQLLALAYPPDALTDAGLDPRGWPGLSSFSAARSLLEAASLLSWSLTPDKTERLRRCAQFQLWSANEGSKSDLGPAPGGPGSVDEVRKTIEAAGFEVQEFGRYNDLGVVLDGQVKTFYTASAISKSLGEPGRRLYRWWSGIAHHASWAVSPWRTLSLRDDSTGMYLSTPNFEDKHLELAADVAAVVLIAGRSLGDFHGKELRTFESTCQQVETVLRQAIPDVRRTLGRPGSDPTQH